MVIRVKTIIEDRREIPVIGEYDTVVAGGGIAGVAAALGAARNGARTLLLERQYMLGDLAKRLSGCVAERKRSRKQKKTSVFDAIRRQCVCHLVGRIAD